VLKMAGLMIAAELALHRYCVVDSANSDRRRRGHHCVLRYFTAGYPETAKLSKDLLKLNKTGKDAMRRLFAGGSVRPRNGILEDRVLLPEEVMDLASSPDCVTAKATSGAGSRSQSRCMNAEQTPAGG
jgi:hypothetical protein